MDEETESGLITLRKEFRAASLPVFLSVARNRGVLPPDFSASKQSIYRLFQRYGLDEVPVAKEDIRRYEAELSNNLWPMTYGRRIACTALWLLLMVDRGSHSDLSL
jgi:hypothetical protein